MTTILLLLFLAPEPPTPLDDLQWLVAGQWESKAKLPNGQPIESRTLWDRGPGRYSLRGRVYIRQKEEEYLQYESIVYLNGKRIEYITFTLQGPVIRGVGRLEKGKLILEQPASTLYPPMRTVYTPDEKNKDRFVGENYWKKDGEWQLVMSAEQRRTPRKARKLRAAKSPVSDKLTAFKPLLGYWEKTAVHSGADTLQFEPSLHGALIRSTSTYTGSATQVHWIYYDPERKTLAVFGCGAKGRVERFDLTLQTGDKRLALTVMDSETEGVARNTMTWKDADQFESRLAMPGDGKWVEDEGPAKYRRIKK